MLPKAKSISGIADEQDFVCQVPLIKVVIGQPTDILAANAAGIMSFGALWGEGNKDKLVGAFPTDILHNPEDILAINRLYITR
ncbi:hypothetical protein AN161_02150 [Lysinibacillus sp. FJAT-14222]|nr:hypothetical protein AN161_02150 [Lysinibacillus sp. FJAT-14222]